MAASLGAAARSREAEKGYAIPPCAGHLRGDGAQRAVVPALILETIGEHRHGNGVAAILPFQQCAGPWDATVKAGTRATGNRRRSVTDVHEVWRWQHPYVGLVGDLIGAPQRCLG